MTLIEVVTGLIILGTILASLAIARGRFMRQWGDAERKLAVTRALGSLIEEWMDAPAPRVPMRGEGPLPGVKDCVWRTQTIRDGDAAKLSAAIVRVEAFGRLAGSRERYSPTPVAMVDLLVYVTPRQATTQPAGVR